MLGWGKSIYTKNCERGRQIPMVMIETKAERMVINMGPHHPSMHGVLRLIVTLDGENVVDCEPVLGYLHRSMEKIAENRTIFNTYPM